jgi:hypothetical protein
VSQSVVFEAAVIAEDLREDPGTVIIEALTESYTLGENSAKGIYDR